MKRLALLGSTGSIGTQTLDVVGRFRDRFEIVALAAGRNVELLVQQAKQFRPRVVSVSDPADVQRVRDALGDPGIECVAEAQAVATAGADLVIAAQVGAVGLEPVVSALRSGADVALANKEVLVMAGQLVLAEARRAGAKLLPLDSEHVAIAQCLAADRVSALRRIVLTASGGPFREHDSESLAKVRPEDALAHPNWEMGAKITIDSATLMNKGFEWIEARWLFDVAPEQIEVLVHPESIVHSLVEFVDGSWLAQLGIPDMRVPIAYTLGAPERLPLPDLPALDLVKLGALRFEEPDPTRFPALQLARSSLERGGTAPAALAGANEVAVEAFLSGTIPFGAITEIAAETQGLHDFVAEPDLPAIRAADLGARRIARELIERRYA